MNPGDLVEVDWHDSSGGRAESIRSLKKIDIPVKSWGIYLGDYGEEEPHIVLMTEIYFKKVGNIGFEVNAIVKRVVKRSRVLIPNAFDISQIAARHIESKVNDALLMHKIRFCVEVSKW